jgi:hypothetical protein
VELNWLYAELNEYMCTIVEIYRLSRVEGISRKRAEEHIYAKEDGLLHSRQQRIVNPPPTAAKHTAPNAIRPKIIIL